MDFSGSTDRNLEYLRKLTQNGYLIPVHTLEDWIDRSSSFDDAFLKTKLSIENNIIEKDIFKVQLFEKITTVYELREFEDYFPEENKE